MAREEEMLREEYKQLKELRKTLETRMAWVHRKLYYPRMSDNRNTVDSRPLIPFIQQAIDNHETIIAISDRCKVSEGTIRNILRGLPISEPSIDRVLTGLGMPHLYDDMVPFVPDPPESKFYEE
jgi:hypothetical protein